MKRSKHSLSHYKLATFDMGQLVPMACYEVLPGDSIMQSTSMLIRVSPLVAPVMHPVRVRIHHWYVPYRVLWSGFEDFITGGKDGQDASTFPAIDPGSGGFAPNSIWDYIGVPPSTPNCKVSAMPQYAYAKIFNEYYRDEDLVNERDVSGQHLENIAWEKDYFTSARPWPQKGPTVTIPLGTTAPVLGVPGGYPTVMRPNAQSSQITTQASDRGVYFNDNSSGSGPVNWDNPQLYADLSQAAGISIDDLRKMSAIQRYQEMRARFGSRYTEYLRAAFGVQSPDGRLQRPEYLGGGKTVISFSEVLQSTPSETPSNSNYSVGDMYGHGIAAVRSRRFMRFFHEHGLVMTLVSVRPRTMYQDGISRQWLRETKEDFYQKELEHIGQQEVYNKELYAAHSEPDNVFGYQDRYDEYRHLNSGVAGEFRNTLNYWHMGRQFASAPALNGDFVKCDPTKRIHNVQSNHVLWTMASHQIQARRVIGKKAYGRLL